MELRDILCHHFFPSVSLHEYFLILYLFSQFLSTNISCQAFTYNNSASFFIFIFVRSIAVCGSMISSYLRLSWYLRCINILKSLNSSTKCFALCSSLLYWANSEFNNTSLISYSLFKFSVCMWNVEYYLL